MLGGTAPALLGFGYRSAKNRYSAAWVVTLCVPITWYKVHYTATEPEYGVRLVFLG